MHRIVSAFLRTDYRRPVVAEAPSQPAFVHRVCNPFMHGREAGCTLVNDRSMASDASAMGLMQVTPITWLQISRRVA